MSPQPQHSDIEKLFVEYQPRLRSFIQKRVSNKEDAEDILQDVFYQLTRALDNTLNPIEEIAAWLYRVARNTIINKYKKKEEEELPILTYEEDESVLDVFSEILFGEESSTPETEYMYSLVWEELTTSLAELPPEQREIFELTELEGLPIKEIAEASGVPANTLLSRKHYAVKYLRKRLENLYIEFLYN
ncbi:RNA polymerase sigma factor [Bacteroidales bacterium OttesenSCG-928-M06]|nr:RNA polymerase sigma factor [Bacteroidales bacterium OttesenSCG-928-M06]